MNPVLALRSSAVLEICLRLYVEHHLDERGNCAKCGIPARHCVPRRNSSKVLRAAQLDPARFDGEGSRTKVPAPPAAWGWGR